MLGLDSLEEDGRAWAGPSSAHMSVAWPSHFQTVGLSWAAFCAQNRAHLPEPCQPLKPTLALHWSPT